MVGNTKDTLPPPSGDAAVSDLNIDTAPSSPENPGSPSGKQADSNQSDNQAAEDQTDMPPGGRGRPHTPKREADLSGLLNGAEKHELSMLIAKITDGMQRQIYRVFDSTGVDTPKDSPPSFWSKLPANLRDFTLGVGTGNGNKGNTNPSGKDNSKQDQRQANLEGTAQETLQKEEREALGTSLQELKKESLQAFRRWQVAVNRRIGEISVKSTGGPLRGQSSGKKGETDTSTTVVEADAALIQLYPPTATSLVPLPFEKRTLILHSMLLLLLSLENYSAFSRILLLNLASSLHVPLHILEEDEVRVAKSLSEVTKDLTGDEVTQKRNDDNRNSRKWKVGLASVAGAAVIGITGGLAAPLVAAGVGTVLGGIGLGGTAAAGLLGAMAESTFVVGTLFGIYGAKAGGKMMEQYAKDVQDFAFLPLHGALKEEYHGGKDVAPADRRLRVVLGISGWLTQREDVVNPWRALGHQNEVYALRWEVDALLKMVLASLMEALWPLGLLKISKIIDNPWSVGMVRADKAGLILADAIINKVQGERGITLIGYSLGARTIYTCLMCLAEKRAFGLVENVVMMGTPAPSDPRVWCTLKSVVAGRLVNVYSENDFILGFLYRTSSVQFGVAGLQRIDQTEGIENVDVSDKVSGHLRYQFLVGSILKHIGWEDVNLEQVARDEETLSLLEAKNKEREQKRAAVEPDMEAAQLEAEIKQKNDKIARKNDKNAQKKSQGGKNAKQ
ncbi:hypothetical protein GE09DRAFT_1233748 [Coniochaeta sp. 2T2.1]|nr:hypothetical protein GE09DRAFT_1233748 [Coniochaeta sp. 2T2.1]